MKGGRPAGPLIKSIWVGHHHVIKGVEGKLEKKEVRRTAPLGVVMGRAKMAGARVQADMPIKVFVDPIPTQ